MEIVTTAERNIPFGEFVGNDIAMFMEGWGLKGYDRVQRGIFDRWVFMKTIDGALRLFEVDKLSQSVRLRMNLGDEGLEAKSLTNVCINEKLGQVIFYSDSGQYEISNRGMSHKTVKMGAVGTFEFDSHSRA